MPLHLEKVRDKLAENIHELWGMNKIELGWSYGKVRQVHAETDKQKKILTLHPCIFFCHVCGEINATEKHFGRVVEQLEMPLVVKHFFLKTESSKACSSSCFLFYNLRFTPKQRVSGKNTLMSLTFHDASHDIHVKRAIPVCL